MQNSLLDSAWAQTAQNLSSSSDALWMQVLINSDSNYATGWKGFDFAVTSYNPTTRTAALKRFNSDGTMKAGETRVPFRMNGNQLALSIPRAALGLADARNTSFDFHWADNAPLGGDIRDWWLLGDSAPNGRFNYRFNGVS